MRAVRPRKLFSYLAVFSLALALPPIILAAIATTYFAKAERTRLETVVDKTNADVTRAIEARIGGAVALLQALSTSPHLTLGDFAAFGAQVRPAAVAQNVVISLDSLDHLELVNTSSPFGPPRTASTDSNDVHFGPNGATPYVSGLDVSSSTGDMRLRVVVPVVRDGQTLYHLNAQISPRDLSQILRESLEPGLFHAMILDRNGVIIGRSADEEEFLGRPLTKLAEAAEVGKQGAWKGLNPKGVPVFAYWRRSPRSGWLVATSVSQAALRAPLYESLLFFAGLAAAMATVAGALAFWVGRKVAQAQEALRELATQLGSDRPLAPPTTPLVEANMVGRAIAQASQRLCEQARLILTAQDGLERQIAERTSELALKTALLESALENMDQGLVALNAKGEMTVCNDHARQLLRAEADGRELGAELRRLRDEHVAREGLAVGPSMVFENHPDGAAFLEIRSTPVTDGGEIFTLTDVSAARRQADELRAAKETAERASFAKSELLATMSHEIRTPLNSMLGSADLLAVQPAIQPAQKRLVLRIIKAGATLATMMEDILDLAQVENGRVTIRTRRFELAELVRDVEILTSAAFAKKDFRLQIVMDPELPRFFEGYDNRLKQVLINYVSNSAKFTFAGSVQMQITGERTESGDWLLRFTVTDTGIGIPREQQKNLFQRYYQADASIQPRFGGSGLGLAISKRLVEAMNGEVGIESEVGRGTTLYFTLPLREAAEPDADPGACLLAATPLARSARILVAEDIRVNQEVARELLQCLGHQVTIVGSGEEAIAAVQELAFDLVLMDIFMTGIDGLSTTRAIRNLEHPARALPIIACTANVLPTQISEFQQAGLDGFVSKPLRLGELYSIVDRFAAVSAEPEDVEPHRLTYRHEAETLIRLIGPDRTIAALEPFDDALSQLLSRASSGGAIRPAEVAEMAHSLISTASLFGMTELASACREIEVACKAKLQARQRIRQSKPLIVASQRRLKMLREHVTTLVRPKPSSSDARLSLSGGIEEAS
jgi:signal transduction histidine kinase/FixJ family two-component response regulator/HPt (histidine-containing phosphotransfer) domain-containing protein